MGMSIFTTHMDLLTEANIAATPIYKRMDLLTEVKPRRFTPGLTTAISS